MAGPVDDSRVLDYFEASMREFLLERFSHVDDWWNACIPPEVREDAARRHENAKKINDVLNKPDYELIDYLNFDGYGRIISRRDNWRNHFEAVFLEKTVFDYKMRVILSLRNDIRHGRRLDEINSTRLRLHCYDVLAQIFEARHSGTDERHAMMVKLGFGPG